MKTLVIIPARKGSKGVVGKNKKILGGKPLIQYTIEAALKVFPSNEICISTNDEEIIKLATSLNVAPPFLRPEELSTDKSSSQDVILHALNYYMANRYIPDVVILLQATSPFRTSFHIREALKLYNSSLDMVVSGFTSKSNPYFNLFETNEKGFLIKSKKSNYTRRQDCPEVFEYNGAIYIINKKSLDEKNMTEFNKNKLYLMDEISSHDIDTPLDWIIAEKL